MNFNHLQLFVRIASTNNISLAGSELGLSPAVASAQIKKLESDLGVRLIHRTTRKVSLTKEGEVFLPHATQLLESYEVACASVGIGSLAPHGSLRVTASASFGRLHIIPALGDFLSEFPKVTVDLHLSDRIVDLVEGGFDLAIRDASLPDSTLICKKLAPVRRVLCASSQYLKSNSSPQTPEELVNHKCINFFGLEKWTFNTPKGKLSIQTNNVLRTDNGEAARDACKAGLGITLSSTWCCYKELQSGELVQVLEDYPIVSDTAVWALYPSTRHLAPKVRSFIDFLANRFGTSPYWEENLS